PIGIPTLRRFGGCYRSDPRVGSVFAHALDGFRMLIDALPDEYDTRRVYYIKTQRLMARTASSGALEGTVSKGDRYRFPSADQARQFLIGREALSEAVNSPGALGRVDGTSGMQVVRGYIRTLNPQMRGLPRTVKHHLFIPYPEWRDAASD